MADPKVKWEQADSSAILVDEANNVWHSGHVNDIVVAEGTTVVATDTGGVWLVSGDSRAMCVSGDWESPNMTCLEPGPHGPRHVYAGGGQKIVFTRPALISHGPDRTDV